MNRSHLPRARQAFSRRAHRAFTLVEVMVAASVMVLSISGALVALQSGLSAVSQARHLTEATSIMQSEIERLRLKNWDQLEILQAAGDTTLPPSGNHTAGIPFKCTRSIRDLRDGMKEIILVAQWGGIDGRAHSARLITRYSRSGLNDYFYASN